MPKVNWGISATDVDSYDRDSQYKPYDGPVPVNGVYKFKVKALKFVAGTGTKLPQMRIGLELVPRNASEKKYAGYYIMLFPPISERTQFRYVPFLDAIGVTGREFEQGTITDEAGNIKKIGRWRNNGDTMIKGEIRDDVDQHGAPRKDIGWMGAVGEEPDYDDDDLEDDDADEYADDDEDGDWE